MKDLLWLSIILLLFGLTASGNLCLSCNYVVSPQTCNNVVRCGDHQECGIHQYMAGGIVLYDLGCKPSYQCASNKKRDLTPQTVSRQTRFGDGKISLCSDCCNGSAICNIGGYCSSPQLDFKTNLVCYHCEQAHDVGSCGRIEKCASGEVCRVDKLKTGFGRDLYHMGCSNKSCTNDNFRQIIRRKNSLGLENEKVKRTDSSCGYCCSTPLCNNKCLHVSNPVTTTKLLTTPTTTSKMTSSIPQTSTQSFTRTQNSTNGSIDLSTSPYPTTMVKHTSPTATVTLDTSSHATTIRRQAAQPTSQPTKIVNYTSQKAMTSLDTSHVTTIRRQTTQPMSYIAPHTSRPTTMVSHTSILQPSIKATHSSEPQKAPHISLYSDPKHVHFGETVTLMCMANGNPKPTMSWDVQKQDGAAVPGNIHPMYHGSVLVINNFTTNNNGWYRCSAKNNLGTDTVTIDIQGY